MTIKIPKSTILFRETIDSTGALLVSEPDASAQLKHHVWFPYNRTLFNQLRPGDFLACQSFQEAPGSLQRYSLMEITQVTPTHFALGQRSGDIASAYPEFTMEVARNSYKDWTRQADRNVDQTTKIRVEAVPLNMAVYTEGNYHIVEADRSRPMPGASTRPITAEMMLAIINAGQMPEQSDVFPLGSSFAASLDAKVDGGILTNATSFMRKHFGIFGFTGVGKSNLMNHLVEKLLNSPETLPDGSLSHPKIVLLDLMDEYKSLLIDQLNAKGVDARYVVVGERGLPAATKNYLQKQPAMRDSGQLEAAVTAFHNQFLLPHSLQRHQDNLKKAVQELLTGNDAKRVGVADLADEEPLAAFLMRVEEANTFTRAGATRIREEYRHDVLDAYRNDNLTKDLASKLAQDTKTFLERQDLPWDTEVPMRAHIENVEAALRRKAEWLGNPSLKGGVRVTLKMLMDGLADPRRPSLYIITGWDADDLRQFAHTMVWATFNRRRRDGRNGPQASFIVDEADEFMPRDASGSRGLSKDAIEQLARRGRKFGLGVGIATQRLAYLDTNSLGQLHSYLVSRLPRDHDRNTIAEAFSLPSSAFDQTFQFEPGDWLLLSHEATGLKGKPISLHTHNSEDRLVDYLASLGEDSNHTATTDSEGAVVLQDSP